ncbi:nitroreductase/quinone reductase family protein [Nocardia nova]|uniref:nitroreductase/quinone reductase family protein n=1 Tax=Nocardia nova TaxID=37330 RepID=UPI001E5A5940|nr:nitroreductase/quinone reductase family protein [Nocardia nova]
MLSKLVRGAALLFPGLLAGAFGYGAVNVLYAFREVPLDVRFTFHVALMRVNGPVMQSLMALAVLGILMLAVRSRGGQRRIAASATVLVLLSFLVTRFGNVPINQQITRWAVGTPPANYAEILRRWELFHFTRTGCAVAAFVLVIVAVVGFTATDEGICRTEENPHRSSARRNIRNRVVVTAHRLGLPFGPIHLLTVAGRSTGIPRTTPVAPIQLDGVQYLVQAYPDAEWVKNARAAGRGVLARGRKSQIVDLVEVPEPQRHPVLRAFPVQNPRGAEAFVRNGLVESGSSESFADAAGRCPVFRVEPVA